MESQRLGHEQQSSQRWWRPFKREVVLLQQARDLNGPKPVEQEVVQPTSGDADGGRCLVGPAGGDGALLQISVDDGVGVAHDQLQDSRAVDHCEAHSHRGAIVGIKKARQERDELGLEVFAGAVRAHAPAPFLVACLTAAFACALV